jgi:hypothetical protein
MVKGILISNARGKPAVSQVALTFFSCRAYEYHRQNLPTLVKNRSVAARSQPVVGRLKVIAARIWKFQYLLFGWAEATVTSHRLRF